MTGMLLILLGFGSFAIWFVQRQQARATMTWPSVGGVIRDARVMFERDGEGRQSPTLSVSYSYVINGAPFFGNRIRVGGGGNHQQLMNRYRVGTPVQVFYDPKNPAAAVLERGGSAVWVWLLVGSLGILAGFVVMAKRP